MFSDDSRVIWQRPLDKVLAAQQSEFYLIIRTQTLKLMFEKHLNTKSGYLLKKTGYLLKKMLIFAEKRKVMPNLLFHPSEDPWCF